MVKLMVLADMLVKSQVAAYTRSDGTMVQSHDNGRMAAAPKATTGNNRRAVKAMKNYHKADAAGLKHSLGSALASGDTLGDDDKPMTYGDVQKHLHTMRASLGSHQEHGKHIEAAQYALNQSFGADHAPVSEKHARNIGAALSGKATANANGIVKAAAGRR